MPLYLSCEKLMIMKSTTIYLDPHINYSHLIPYFLYHKAGIYLPRAEEQSNKRAHLTINRSPLCIRITLFSDMLNEISRSHRARFLAKLDFEDPLSKYRKFSVSGYLSF